MRCRPKKPDLNNKFVISTAVYSQLLFWSFIPAGNLRLVFLSVFAFLAVIPEGNPLSLFAALLPDRDAARRLWRKTPRNPTRRAEADSLRE